MVALDSWQYSQDAGNLAIARGLYDTAIAEYERALVIAKKSANLASKAETLRALANVYLVTDKIQAAKEHIIEAREIDLSFWGEQSHVLANDDFLLAAVWQRQGDLHNARKLFMESLSIKTALLGQYHEEIFQLLVYLIWVALEEGHQSDLMKFSYQAYELFKQVHPEGMFAKSLLIKSFLMHYIAEGRYIEADAICTRLIYILRNILGDHNRDLAEAMSDCAEVMKLANKHLNAWHLKSRSLKMDDLFTFERQADALMHKGEYEEAQILLRRLLDNLRKRTAPDKTVVTRVLRKYSDTMFKLGRLSDADLLKRQADRWEQPDPPEEAIPGALFWF
jgi:tetratricopeptide (TPR) repeat protein